MLCLLQQTVNITQAGLDSCENNKKTEMEWKSLLNCVLGVSQQNNQKNESAITLHSDKKFEKDSTGMWVWYKNQVLPTLKIKINQSNFKPILLEKVEQNQLEIFVHIQCFAVFSNNQIIEVKLEGTTIVKVNKDKTADLRSIRLTETINSLNVKLNDLIKQIF